MVKRSRGTRSKTRYKLKKSVRERGLPNVSKLLQEYNEGDSVAVKIDPSIHRGMPHPRFHGKIGKILEKRGNAYVLKIKDGNKQKQLIVKRVVLTFKKLVEYKKYSRAALYAAVQAERRGDTEAAITIIRKAKPYVDKYQRDKSFYNQYLAWAYLLGEEGKQNGYTSLY